jgi:hypothetical protein
MVGVGTNPFNIAMHRCTARLQFPKMQLNDPHHPSLVPASLVRKLFTPEQYKHKLFYKCRLRYAILPLVTESAVTHTVPVGDLLTDFLARCNSTGGLPL